jgi:hypothetical protein
VAGPARVLSSPLTGTTTFAIAPGGTLTLVAVANGAPATTHTVTIAGTPARAVGAGAPGFPLNLAGAVALPVTVDGLRQTVTIAAGTYNAANDLLIAINSQRRRASAVLGTGGEAGRIVLVSDHHGSTASLTAGQGDDLGFTDPTTGTPGTGNVADCDGRADAGADARRRRTVRRLFGSPLPMAATRRVARHGRRC